MSFVYRLSEIILFTHFFRIEPISFYLVGEKDCIMISINPLVAKNDEFLKLSKAK